MQHKLNFFQQRFMVRGKKYRLQINCEGRDTYLTRRETKIVLMMINGKRAKQIAWDLNSSPHTVNTHLANIKEKLSCSNIFQLGLILGCFKEQLALEQAI
ncbi:MAG: helix-turn-helix transcriptional regulator [Romboutsia sp.]|nr:helix-turn-helix transcriptional regulator [Romboutsia sp.]